MLSRTCVLIVSVRVAAAMEPVNPNVFVVVPRSTYRYSSFADQLPTSAVSTPPPSVQPLLVSLKLPEACCNMLREVLPVKCVSFSRRPAHAAPPVTYHSQPCWA